jgi:phospholipid N-methyltransferase
MSDTSLLHRKSKHQHLTRRRVKRFLKEIKPGVQDRFRFLGAFLRRPACVGALAPSSRRLALEMIDGCVLATCDTIVELGPGTGAFTGPILESIGAKTTFFAMELDPALSKGLRTRFPALTVYNDSAEKIQDYLGRHGKKRADYIISGLPWASLPLKVQDNILAEVLRCLAPGGLFVTFGYLHARWMPNALRFRRKLGKYFKRVESSRAIWRNFPPAFVYRCTR